MHKDTKLNLIGVLLTLVGLFSFYTHFIAEKGMFLFWYCNHMALIGGILILLRKRNLLHSLINVGVVPTIIWTLDFALSSFIGRDIFGAVSYVFSEKVTLLYWSYMQHIYVVPLLILGLYYLGGPVKNALRNSLIYGAILWIFGWTFNPEYNMNCARRLCVPIMPNSVYSMIFQYAFIIGMIFISNKLLLKYVKANKN